MTTHRVLFIVLLALAPASALAVLGKTAAECRQQYGNQSRGPSTRELPTSARTKYYYRWHGYYAEALFVGRDVADSRCASISYQSESNVTPNGTIKELTAAEIDILLALNANGSSWEKAPGGWKRKDNRAFAKEYKSTRNGSPYNQLYVFDAAFDPIVAAMVTAGSPPK
jgi:hypothetical protein